MNHLRYIIFLYIIFMHTILIPFLIPSCSNSISKPRINNTSNVETTENQDSGNLNFTSINDVEFLNSGDFVIAGYIYGSGNINPFGRDIINRGKEATLTNYLLYCSNDLEINWDLTWTSPDNAAGWDYPYVNHKDSNLYFVNNLASISLSTDQLHDHDSDLNEDNPANLRIIDKDGKINYEKGFGSCSICTPIDVEFLWDNILFAYFCPNAFESESCNYSELICFGSDMQTLWSRKLEGARYKSITSNTSMIYCLAVSPGKLAGSDDKLILDDDNASTSSVNSIIVYDTNGNLSQITGISYSDNIYYSKIAAIDDESILINAELTSPTGENNVIGMETTISSSMLINLSLDYQVIWKLDLRGKDDVSIDDFGFGPDNSIYFCGLYKNGIFNNNDVLIAAGDEQPQGSVITESQGYLAKVSVEGKIAWVVDLAEFGHGHASAIDINNSLVIVGGVVEGKTFVKTFDLNGEILQ